VRNLFNHFQFIKLKQFKFEIEKQGLNLDKKESRRLAQG